MTLGETLQQNLARPIRQPQTFTIEAAQGARVEADVEASDALACRLRGLRVQRPAQDAEPLPQWAHRVARQASGLLEPLAVHEIDTQRGEARLRSQTPSQKGDEVHYYEAVLNTTGQASLHRYRASYNPHQPREPIPFTLTHEAVGKLVDDFLS
uniref:Hypothetical conserved protein n=1 Tax=uncultured Planctomycetota bacterium TaxID=120965 RepID=H5SDG4_9BACT|nr:hypothetical conserved protein [uncultured Planctomycetota bacterium]